MKRFLVLIVALAVMVGLIGCGSTSGSPTSSQEAEPQSSAEAGEAPSAAGEELVIGLAQCDLSDTWESYFTDALKAKAEEIGAKMIVTDAMNDSNKQIADVENLLEQGADVIITILVDTTSPTPVINACREKNVPLVGAVRQFSGADVFVGVDFTKMAMDQAAQVAEAIGQKGNIGLLMGTMGNDDQIKRTDGNKEALKNYPDITIIMEDSGEWDRAKGLAIVENWLQTGQQFDAILSNNDEMAIGAIRALEAQGLNGKVIVAGVDGTPDALQLVKSGDLTFTYFFNPFSLADQVIEYCQSLAAGAAVTEDQKVTLLDLELITKDNYATYMGYWGIEDK